MHDRSHIPSLLPGFQRPSRAMHKAPTWVLGMLLLLAVPGCTMPPASPEVSNPSPTPARLLQIQSEAEAQDDEPRFGFTLVPDPGMVYRLRLAENASPVWLIYREQASGKVVYRCAAPTTTGKESCPHPPVALRPPWRLEVNTGAGQVEVVVEQAPPLR